MTTNGTTPARALRYRTGLNQSDFWSRIGVTQSGGSRYESGRRVPKPVQILLDLAYAPPKAMQKTFLRLRPEAVTP